MNTRFLVPILAVFLLFSCEKPQIKQENKKYFDLVQWIGDVGKATAQKQGVLKKTALINGNEENQKLDKVNWESELALFAEADLNSPALWDDYQITENAAEESLIYESQNPSNKVQKIQIKGYPQKVREVLISLNEKNQFYESKRNMVLEVLDNQVVRYKIEGMQKILFRDPMHYQVVANWE